jgi:hypothetical protein
MVKVNRVCVFIVCSMPLVVVKSYCSDHMYLSVQIYILFVWVGGKSTWQWIIDR